MAEEFLHLFRGDADGDYFVCDMDIGANPAEVGHPLGFWEGEFESQQLQVRTVISVVSSRSSGRASSRLLGYGDCSCVLFDVICSGGEFPNGE